MKNLIILIALILLVAFTGNAKAETRRLVGELVNEGETLAVYTVEGRVVVHAEQNVDDCFAGEYAVRVEPKGSAQFKLIGTVLCRGKATAMFRFDEKDNKKMNTEKSNKEIAAKTICPMIYVPVCGLVNNVPHTFSNSCELTNAKAKKLFLGSCDQAIGAGIKGHQDLTSFQIQIQ